VATPELVLDDRILNCVLMQTRPGKELDVKGALEKEFGDKAKVFLGLGRYDLTLLSERQDFSLFKEFRNNPIEGVIDWYNICGGRWTVNGSESRPFAFDDAKEIGICLIKTSKAGLGGNRVELEKVVASRLLENKQVSVYSNLSNYGLVCLMPVADMASLNECLKHLKSKLLTDSRNLLALDIVTIPSVNLKYASELEETIRVLLFLSVRMAANARLWEDLRNILRGQGCKLLRTIPSYGFHDIVVEIEGSLGAVIQSILNLRKNSEEYGLFSTFTLIEHEAHVFDYIVPMKLQEEEEHKSTDDSQHRDPLHKQELTSHFENLLSVGKQDYLTCELFRDHTKLVEKMEEMKRRSDWFKTRHQKKLYQTWLLKYDNLVDCLRLTLSQRYNSVVPGNLLGTKSLSLDPHGGIQRGILAVESLPLYLYKKLQLSWEGFCVFGYYHRFFRQEGGMFNIPLSFRVKPKKWGGGLFHEIGHELFLRLSDDFLLEITNFVQKSHADILQKYGYLKRPIHNEDELMRDIINLTTEIFADLFSFATCYQCQWEKYRDDFWKELAREFPIDYRRLVRSVVVYLALGRGKDLDLKLYLKDKQIMDWIDTLEAVVQKTTGVRIADNEKRNAIPYIKLFAEFGRIVAPFFKDEFWKVDSSPDTILDKINAGIVHNTENPLEIIWALTNSEGELSLKGDLTAILSLYNCYWNIHG